MAGDPPARRARLLVLGAGPAQLGLLEAARARDDLTVIAVDRDAGAVGFALADKRALISSEDEPAIERLARAEGVDGIISPGADWPVGIAARVAERMGLPHPLDGVTAGLATSKASQRERFGAAGVPQPACRTIVPGAEVGLGVPCVIKAPDRQGQRGLTLVRERGELVRAVAEAVAASRSASSLAEELVEGPEVTINAVSLDGEFRPLTITDRLVAEPPAFGVALAHAWPSAYETVSAIDAARRAAEALGIRNGPTYTQVVLAPDGVRVLELAARLGGGHDAELCEAALGVDLNDLAIDFSLGRRPEVPPVLESAATDGVSRSRGAGACVLFLVAPEGELRAVHGLEEARAVAGVRWVRVYRRPGWRFGPLRRGPDRAGAILAVGENREDALERARRAAQAVRFEIDADPA